LVTNIATVKGAKLSPKRVDRLWNNRLFFPNFTNQTKQKIPWAGNYKDMEISGADVKNMKTRLENYRKDNKGKDPSYVNVLALNTTTVTSMDLTSDQQKFLNSYNNIFGKHSTAKSFTDKFRSRGYAFYLNAYEITKGTASQGNLNNSLNRFKNKVDQNCCDLTLLVVSWLFLNGYSVEICQTACKGKSYTHLFCRAKGKELGDNFVNIDIAPMASKTASYCEFGKMGFCQTNGKPDDIIAVNPKWYINMYYNALTAVGFVK
jgi:hypothetical protein